MQTRTEGKVRLSSIFMLLLVTAVLVALGVMVKSRLTESRESGHDPNATDVSPVEVRTTAIVQQDPDVRAVFHGFLAPFLELSISAQVSGQIVEQWVDVPDSIRKGQALYKIDDAVRGVERDQALATLERLKADLALAKSEWERIQGLGDEQSAALEREGAEARLLSAEANTRQAEAALRGAELLVERCMVSSPIDAVVSRVHFREGEFVLAGTPLFDVIQVDRLKLLAELEDWHVVWLKVGQTATLTTQTFPGERFEGTVHRVFPKAMPTSRKFEVEIELPNPGQRLRPGFFMTGMIQKPAELAAADDLAEILIIPREAVIELFGRKFCYVVRPAQQAAERYESGTLVAFRTPVTVQPLAANFRAYQLVEGAAAGDLVVTKGLQHLSEETPVQITD